MKRCDNLNELKSKNWDSYIVRLHQIAWILLHLKESRVGLSFPDSSKKVQICQIKNKG